MYNFSIPAILKAYIDHIVRVNVTFTPSYEGLLKGKKLTFIIASREFIRRVHRRRALTRRRAICGRSSGSSGSRTLLL